MDISYWQGRWQNGEIGFHLPRAHPKLLTWWPDICPDHSASVFVPLAGKTLDLLWLHARGHRVIAVEASELAIQAFFHEQRLTPAISIAGAFRRYDWQRLSFYCGDYFALTADELTGCTHVYDRAALIALPAAVRVAYVQHMQRLMPTAAVLLLTLVYSQNEMPGPPFAVTPDEVAALFAHAGTHATLTHAEQRLLQDHDILAQEPRFAGKGVTALREQAWSLRW